MPFGSLQIKLNTMNSARHLKDLFPVTADIPESVRLQGPVHQRRVLIDGELIDWNGPVHVADSLKKMHPKSNRLKSILGLDAKNAAIVLLAFSVDSVVVTRQTMGNEKLIKDILSGNKSTRLSNSVIF